MLSLVVKNTSKNNNLFVSAKKYEHLTDEQLVEEILNGSTSLFEVIMRRYNQRLFRIQRSYIKDDHTTRDALQTTYIQAYKHLNQFKGEAKFSTWLTRIAINEALKCVNKRKRYIRLHKPEAVNDTFIDSKSDINTPEQNLIQSDLKNILEQSIDQLPDKYRTVYVMREIEEMSSKETAKALNISETNVKVRLFRAKAKLRKILEDSAKVAEAFEFMGERCDNLVLDVMNEIKNLNQ